MKVDGANDLKVDCYTKICVEKDFDTRDPFLFRVIVYSLFAKIPKLIISRDILLRRNVDILMRCTKSFT